MRHLAPSTCGHCGARHPLVRVHRKDGHWAVWHDTGRSVALFDMVAPHSVDTEILDGAVHRYLDTAFPSGDVEMPFLAAEQLSGWALAAKTPLILTLTFRIVKDNFALTAWQCPRCPHVLEGMVTTETMVDRALFHLRTAHKETP